MSKPLKYSLVEIDGLTGQSRKQRKRSVTKKYRKAKPFRRKHESGVDLRQENKIINLFKNENTIIKKIFMNNSPESITINNNNNNKYNKSIELK